MCCRYFADLREELVPMVEEMNRSPLLSRVPAGLKIIREGEVRPTNVAPVVATTRNGHRAVFPMKWGFLERTLLINARTETAGQKPVFRDAWAAHRCAIPASWYFEWEHLSTPDGRKKTGDKYRLRPEKTAVTWLGGLYRLEGGFPCFVVLTREPGESIRFIHDRMPLILPDSRISDWIRPDADPAEIAASALTDLRFERDVSAENRLPV